MALVGLLLGMGLVGCSSERMPLEPELCELEDACREAPLLGEIPGDIPSETIQHEGTLSTWVLVDVLEEASGLSPVPMRVIATLTSPPGTTFELRAYAETTPYNADGGPTPPATGLLADCDVLASDEDDTQRVELLWGETDPEMYANGVEDGRRVAFEIRHVEGDCPEDESWRLVVQGG